MPDASPVLRPSTRNTKRGFALLIVVILLSFVVVLVVGLAIYARIEGAVASNTQRQAQARQNALLGLNVALAELQKHAGRDTSITATRALVSESNPNYTGVWKENAPEPIWLVSGVEAAPDPSHLPVTLVGANTVGQTNSPAFVTAPAVAIRAYGVPGQSANDNATTGGTKIGFYAWWIGDQGVKASVGLADRANEVTYAPWDNPAQRNRIRQQIAVTPSYFRNATSRYGFEPFDAGNASRLKNIVGSNQLSLLSPLTSNALTPFMRDRYHDLTSSTWSVIANTRSDTHRGLMRDLSLKPDELGAEFARYSDFATYLEAPSDDNGSFPPIKSVESPRRRARITAASSDTPTPNLPGATFGIAPVLADFLLQFSVEDASSTQVRVGVRFYVSLWNPYTTALIPDDSLSLDISGLPPITVRSASTGATVTFNLQQELPIPITASNAELGGTVFRVFPRFNSAVTQGSQSDKTSWLPGRVYGWTTKANADGAIDETLRFYNKNINTAQRWFLTNKATTGANSGLSVTAPGTSDFKIQLRNSAGVLATYTLPRYLPLNIPSTTSTIWFGYGGRLRQPSTGDSEREWLKLFDPRGLTLNPTAFVGFDPNQDPDPTALDPSLYNSSTVTTVHSEFLLYRVQGSTATKEPVSAYNDATLFELPRLPLLSVGELQHLQLTGRRPYSIGNSWGGNANSIFDRFFFSGIPRTGNDPDLRTHVPLPNWNLLPVDSRVAPSAPLDLDAVRDNSSPLTSRFLLQQGGFNVNSASQSAWRAILSGVRFGSSSAFTRVEPESDEQLPAFGSQVETSPGTVNEQFTADATLGSDLPAPTFLRFPQTAQETYFWSNDAGTSTTANARQMPTDAFRLGVRGASRSFPTTDEKQRDLTVEQLESLATEIVGFIKLKAADSGPFRSMEEFLSPSPLFNDKSLLEAAIDRALINPPAITFENVDLTGPGFSSLTLSQADLLTALAPYLRTRSDTFTIRAYGEAVNPITQSSDSRAVVEATVQRVPATFDPADDVVQPAPEGFGRRFKIISLRWLTLKDI